MKFPKEAEKYDVAYKPTKKELDKFPDIQNGPSSLIQGSKVEIQQVGMHNFRLPLKYKTRDEQILELETKVGLDEAYRGDVVWACETLEINELR